MSGSVETKPAARPLIEVTPQALERFREVLQDPANANRAIRLGVRGGGCSGFSM